MIYQSHWSKPRRWSAQNPSIADMLFMYAASAHSLRQSFGMPVAMIADSEFSALVNGLPMPYDLLTTELDDLHASPRWWASAKFHIFKKYAPQHKRMFQMDTDVFFWEPTAVGDHVGLLVQSVEQDNLFKNSYELPVKFFEAKFREMGLTREQTWPWRPDLKSALNCGVVGFAKADDAVEYATMAQKICDMMTPFLGQFRQQIPETYRRGSPMVVPEQYFLQCFAKDRDLYTAYVCTKLDSGKLSYYDPDDYYHAMGDKVDPAIRLKFAKLVRLEQPELYHAIVARYGTV